MNLAPFDSKHLIEPHACHADTGAHASGIFTFPVLVGRKPPVSLPSDRGRARGARTGRYSCPDGASQSIFGLVRIVSTPRVLGFAPLTGKDVETHFRSPRALLGALIIVWLSVAQTAGQAATPTLRAVRTTSAVVEDASRVSRAWRTDLAPSERREVSVDERVALAEAGVTSVAQLSERTTCTEGATYDGGGTPATSTLSAGVFSGCPVCVKGIPCGNTCISARYTCHTLGGCAGDGFPTTPVVPEYAHTPEFVVSQQSGYPTVPIGSSTDLALRVLVVHGPSWFDRDVGMYVSNPDEAGEGLRGWDRSGLIAYNKGVTFIGASQEFTLRSKRLPGVHRLRVKFVHKTFGTVGPDGVYWDVNVPPSTSGLRLWEGWHSRWVGQSEYPTMYAGEVRQFWIRFANVGTETWTRGVWGRQVNLALNGDDKTPFRLGMASNWLWDDRIATTGAPSIRPGETAEFRFQVRAPLQPGTYTLNLRPVVDGLTWLEDEGVFWTIAVL